MSRHDIPLFTSATGGTAGSTGTLNMFCEIPKWTRPKFEIATGEYYNPIKQDTKSEWRLLSLPPCHFRGQEE